MDPTTISGQIPAGSPIVIAVTGLNFSLIVLFLSFLNTFVLCFIFLFHFHLLVLFYYFCFRFSIAFYHFSRFKHICITVFVNIYYYLRLFFRFFSFFRFVIFLSWSLLHFFRFGCIMKPTIFHLESRRMT